MGNVELICGLVGFIMVIYLILALLKPELFND